MPFPREVELKLAIAPAAIEALRTHPAIEAASTGRWVVSNVDSRYFDTPDHALAAARIALRLRRVGRAWMQTLKASGVGDAPGGALSARGEWEMPLDGPALALDRFGDTPLAALADAPTLATRLKPVFTTRFRRETRLLRLKHDVDVELAIDQGTIACGRGAARRTASICEVEIEVKAAPADMGDGVHDALLRFALVLARDVALLPLARSKAERGYRLSRRQDDEPAKVELPAASGDVDDRRHAAAVLAACAHAATTNTHALLAWRAARADDAAVADPEFVHQTRVAVRKLRSALRLFEPIVGKRRTARIDRAWRVLGSALGAARDADVLVASAKDVATRALAGPPQQPDAHATVPAEATTVAELARVIEDAARLQRRGAFAALLDALATPAAGVADLLLAREVERLRHAVPSAPLAALAERWLDAQARRVAMRARRIAVLDDEARHRLRIEVKRLRYGLGFFDGLYPDTGYVDLVGALQEELGALTDAVVQRDRLSTLLDADRLADARRRYDGWLHHRLQKRLPKVAKLAVELELQAKPWRR